MKAEMHRKSGLFTIAELPDRRFLLTAHGSHAAVWEVTASAPRFLASAFRSMTAAFADHEPGRLTAEDYAIIDAARAAWWASEDPDELVADLAAHHPVQGTPDGLECFHCGVRAILMSEIKHEPTCLWKRALNRVQHVQEVARGR